MRRVVAYFAETNRYPLGLQHLPARRYHAYWVDPADGAKTVLEDAAPAGGRWFSPAKPGDGDALLVLEAVE
jgi:hypothetical protein